MTVLAELEETFSAPVVESYGMTEARRDDYILWLSILKRGFVAYGLQEDLARYRVVRGSLSSKPKRSAPSLRTSFAPAPAISTTAAATSGPSQGRPSTSGAPSLPSVPSGST